MAPEINARMRQAIPIVPIQNHFPETLSHIAGESAEGRGVCGGFVGAGDRTHSEIEALAIKAYFDPSWLIQPKSPDAQLGVAVKKVAKSNNLDTRPVIKGRLPKDADRAWESRWHLVTRAPVDNSIPALGQPYGTTVAEITLRSAIDETTIDEDKPTKIYTLEINTSNEGLRIAVQAEYDARVGSIRYEAGDISRWLRGVIKYRLDGVEYGLGWYVPPHARVQFEALVAAFAPSWGRRWMTPPLPIISCAELTQCIAIGLQVEIDGIMEGFAKLRANARAAGKTDIGHEGAANVMIRLRKFGERIVAFDAQLSDDLLAGLQDRLHDAMVDLDGILGAVDFDREWTEIVQSRRERETVAAEKARLLAVAAADAVRAEEAKAAEMDWDPDEDQTP